MPRADELQALLARVEEAKGGSRDLDASLWWHCRLPAQGGTDGDILENIRQWGVAPALDRAWGRSWRADRVPPTYTTSVDAARDLIREALPDWWISSGLCSLTGHASIGPDYNGPAGDRLRAEWPEERYHEGFHADLKPGDGPHRECLALIAALLSALISQEAEHGR